MVFFLIKNLNNLFHDTLLLEAAFSFGKNWQRFLSCVNEERIVEAEKSLKDTLHIETLEGKIFLDVGCGSGLFSLAAARLGAVVYSFDYDKDCMQCAHLLKEKYGLGYDWHLAQGSVLDAAFLKVLPRADIVYSWGVLHHTGHMYQAFENVISLVKPGSRLLISIYNDQGGASKRWLWVKKNYNRNILTFKCALLTYSFAKTWFLTFLRDFFKCANPFKSWVSYSKNRGMSAWCDLVDWVGGYPFQVAKPEEVFSFFKERGFELEKLKTCAGGIGCNEFLFIRRVL